MPLNFDKYVVATESIDQKLGSIIRILGSARVSGAGFGVPPKRTSQSPRRRDVVASTRDACATRIIMRGEQRNEPFCKFRQFVPPDRALSFLAAQMRLG